MKSETDSTAELASGKTHLRVVSRTSVISQGSPATVTLFLVVLSALNLVDEDSRDSKAPPPSEYSGSFPTSEMSLVAVNKAWEIDFPVSPSPRTRYIPAWSVGMVQVTFVILSDDVKADDVNPDQSSGKVFC